MTPLRCVTFGDVAMGETGYRWPDPCESPLSAYPVTPPSRCYQEGQRVPGGGWLAPYCAARPKPYQCRVIRARGTKEPLCAIEHGWENTGNPCVATVHRGGQCRTDVPQWPPIAMWADNLLPFMPGERVVARQWQESKGIGYVDATGTVEWMDRNLGALTVLWDEPVIYGDASPTEYRATFTANNVPHLVRLL